MGWEDGGTPWVPEDIASMSIGQFVVQVTPIQLARARDCKWRLIPHFS